MGELGTVSWTGIILVPVIMVIAIGSVVLIRHIYNKTENKNKDITKMN